MHVRTLRLDSEPPLVVALHPRLTVVDADAATRARIVEALERAFRGGPTEVHGALHGVGVQLDFASESDGELARGAAVIRGDDLLPGDRDAQAAVAALDAARTRRRRAEARHAEAQALVGALEEGADVEPSPAGGEPERGRDATEVREVRDQLARVLERLDAVLADAWDAGTPVPTHESRALLEQGTLLAADLARRGLCSPSGVRAVLEAVDALAVAPDLPPAVRHASVRAEPAVVELDAALRRLEVGHPGSSEPGAARLQEARSHALASFADVEAARRAEVRAAAAAGPGGAGDDDRTPSPGALSLRRRFAAVAAQRWPGPAPVILDDALAGLAPTERADLLAELAAASVRTQVVYLTDDPEVLAWADALPSEVGIRAPTATSHP